VTDQDSSGEERKAERTAPGAVLRRELGLVDAVGVGLGAIIGAGIFVVTGVAAGVAGPAFLVGLLLAGVAATCNAFSSAQLAAVYPQAGGTYEYGYRVLHPWLGFAAGWKFLASKLAAGGTVMIGFGSYLAGLVPALRRGPPRALERRRRPSLQFSRMAVDPQGARLAAAELDGRLLLWELRNSLPARF
jgi:amino acid transporter